MIYVRKQRFLVDIILFYISLKFGGRTEIDLYSVFKRKRLIRRKFPNIFLIGYLLLHGSEDFR